MYQCAAIKEQCITGLFLPFLQLLHGTSDNHGLEHLMVKRVLHCVEEQQIKFSALPADKMQKNQCLTLVIVGEHATKKNASQKDEGKKYITSALATVNLQRS